ncbi:glutamate-rich protein 6 [Clinocottus analis]|uniref:glutamate-rich protein 6 n=1 Tax=Clinocottus analis TaxID=304258 RepID=UPI0035C0F666
MSSSSLYAATFQHDLGDAPPVLHYRKPEGRPHSVGNRPVYYLTAEGVLRYNRETDHHRMSLTPIVPGYQALTAYPVKCEYCGQEAKPSLDLSWAQVPQALAVFCCAQRRRLCSVLVKQRRVVEERCALRAARPTATRNKPKRKMNMPQFKTKEIFDHNSLVMELTKRIGKPSDLMKLLVAKVPDPPSNNFRMSLVPTDGCWTLFPCSTIEEQLKIEAEKEKAVLPPCDHETLSFGMCHHQHGAGLIQKYYSNGVTFLTAFPDGSVQVFYPSGLLALVVSVTKKNGRVCIVYDDCDAADQPMRALFQSDGSATCYHSNRNIWLSLDRSGGQCLDERGSRVRRWRWSSLGGTATPLYPVFLSLNDTIGVRVFGKEHVFVSFLTRGQQAKFSVGSCCAQHECDMAPAGAALFKEDLFVKVARIRICLVIQQLHQYLLTPSCARLPKIKQAAHLRVVAQQLLDISTDVTMGENERTFIQSSLHSCL